MPAAEAAETTKRWHKGEGSRLAPHNDRHAKQHTVASTILQYLHRRGVRHIFGIVGREATVLLFDEQSDIHFVLTRHEFAASVMADVLARLTGIPQVCFSTIGPGVTNLTTGIASACLDRSPVIALAAQVERYDTFYNQTHQCLDSVSIMQSMTKFAAELKRPEEIVALLDQAYQSSLTEQLGPSFLSLPIDLLAAEVPSAVTASVSERTFDATGLVHTQTAWRQQLDRVAELLRHAVHPLIVAGGAVARQGGAGLLQALAEQLNIPVVTSYAAKGLLPHAHELNFGAMTSYMDGILDLDALDTIFGPADVLVTFGYDYAEDLRPRMWSRGIAKQVVRIASTPNEVREVFRPDIDIVSPLSESLAYLLRVLAGEQKKVPHDISVLREHVTRLAQDTTDHSEGFTPFQVIAQINRVIADGILVTDVGLYRHFAVIFARVDRPGAFVTSDGCSTFGFGLPAAMAARLATPDKPVILLCGDGGFHASSPDLETAVRCKLPVVVVLLKNNANGLIRLYQEIGHGRSNPDAVEFGTVDYVGLARANGWAGFSVERVHELGQTLEMAIARGIPTLIEVPIWYPELAMPRLRSAGTL
jgi:acetolactate synthase-1/2/3 large subunit/N2-(2-carboxyethyl)arginine synthase